MKARTTIVVAHRLSTIVDANTIAGELSAHTCPNHCRVLQRPCQCLCLLPNALVEICCVSGEALTGDRRYCG